MKKIFSVLLSVALLSGMMTLAVSAVTEGPVPFATKVDGTVLSGKASEPQMKDWTISDTELYINEGKDQGYFIFDDEMQAGRLEATLVTNAASASCNGIVFGLTDYDNDLIFWEGGDVGMYWLMVDENNQLRLCRVGNNANYEGGGWYDMIPDADRFDLDDKGYDVTKGVTIAAEWDGKGSIKCYVGDELAYDITDHTPNTGSLYGVRMKDKTASGAYFTKFVAGVEVEEPEQPEQPTPKPPKTGDMVILTASVALLALIGTGIVVAKKRSFN